MAAARLVSQRGRRGSECGAGQRCNADRRFDVRGVVVVTSPELWPWVAPSLDERTLVYDCMDDALAFDQDETCGR